MEGYFEISIEENAFHAGFYKCNEHSTIHITVTENYGVHYVITASPWKAGHEKEYFKPIDKIVFDNVLSKALNYINSI